MAEKLSKSKRDVFEHVDVDGNVLEVEPYKGGFMVSAKAPDDDTWKVVEVDFETIERIYNYARRR